MKAKINAINAVLVAMLVLSVFLAIPVGAQVTAEMYLEPGYIDGNNHVGLYDATQVSTTYAQMKPWYLHKEGKTPPAWHRFVNAKGINVQSDINLDGAVGLKDAVLLAVHYWLSVP